MPETVHRFIPARELMNLVAGNWANWKSDLETEREHYRNDDPAYRVLWIDR